ncbi:hypothetical protein EDD16DRAFT_1690945 [Pisolithus croceorrhizus]|nr:hypothetical protein EDD16DRAFT_1690945 [Pisolithus croceorrhizus]
MERPAASTFQLPSSLSKHYHPYFTPAEQRGKLSVSQEEKARQQACGFIEAVGFKDRVVNYRRVSPRRTIATAQNLYQRFHLFFPRKGLPLPCQTSHLPQLYVSTKMHDTLKKPREILMVAYALRKSKTIGGEVRYGPDGKWMASTVEHDRQRVLAVERLILETICFNFTSKMPFPYVIKLGRKLGVANLLKQKGDWEAMYLAEAEDLEEIAHILIDLLMQAAQNPSANTSPRTPSSPSPHPSPRNQHFSSSGPPHTPQIPYKFDQLLQLKIAMRENEHPPRPDRP